MRFAGRPVLVTGGGAGLGRAVVLRLAAEGAPVAVVDLNKAALDETVDAARALGVEAIGIDADVTDSDAVAAMIGTASERLGPLWGAVNNAGRMSKNQLLGEYDEAHWDEVLDLNLRAVFLCCRSQLAHLAENGAGAIVNVSSLAGIRGSLTGESSYITSKHGVIGLTKSAARDYASRGIRVNAVCPGGMLTPMLEAFYASKPEIREAATKAIPMRRIGDPSEVAAAIVFLLSDDASYVTGQALPVDGGASL